MDISIIIPCYNSSTYINKCIRSICNQLTSAEFEIIFVDDCSCDNTTEEIERTLRENNYSGAYRIIEHSINKGVAEARITGVKNAVGEYIMFCDSDDWMDSRMCDLMYKKAVQGNCDLIICDYIDVYDTHTSVCSACYNSAFLQSLLLCKCTGSLWNKLIKKSILMRDDFIFPTASYCEDYVFSIQLAIYAKSIGYIAQPLYYYVHRKDSIVNTKTLGAISKKVQENLENYMLVERILEDNGLSNIYYSERIALKMIVKNSLRFYFSYKGYYRLWLKTFPELIIEMFRSTHISNRARISYFLTMFGLYPLIKKF